MKVYFDLLMFAFCHYTQWLSAKVGLGTWTHTRTKHEFHNYIKFAPFHRLGWRTEFRKKSCTQYFHFIWRSYRVRLTDNDK